MKLYIIPVRITDLPLYLSEKLILQTSRIKVRTKDQRIFAFDTCDTRISLNNNVLNFVIALNDHCAKDIDRFFFMNEKDELLYVSRNGISMKQELDKLYVGELI